MTHRDSPDRRTDRSFIEPFADPSRMMVMLRDVALACVTSVAILAIVIVVATWPAMA